jgi:hypothetical protein
MQFGQPVPPAFFDPSMMMSAGGQGVEPPQPEQEEPDPTEEEVLQLIRSDRMRCFRIGIETDSTIDAALRGDIDQYSQVIGAISQMLNQIMPLVQQGILPLDTAKALSISMARKTRLGTSVEDALDAMREPAPPPEEQQPDQSIEMGKMELQAAIEQEKLKMENGRLELQAAIEQEKLKLEQWKLQVQGAVEQEKAQLEERKLQLEIEKLQMQREIEMARLATTRELDLLKLQAELDLEKMKLSATTAVSQAELDDAQIERETSTALASAELAMKQQESRLESIEKGNQYADD